MSATAFYIMIDSTMNAEMDVINSGLNQLLATLQQLHGHDIRLGVYSYSIGSTMVQALKRVNEISSIYVRGTNVSYRNLNQAIRVVLRYHDTVRGTLPRGNKTYLVVVTKGASVPALAAEAKSSLTALGFDKVFLYGLGLSDPGAYGEFPDELDYDFSCDSRSVKTGFQRLESRLKELVSGQAASNVPVQSPTLSGRSSPPRPSGSRMRPRPSSSEPPSGMPILEPILEPISVGNSQNTGRVVGSDGAELERLRKELSKVTQEKAALESKAEESRIALKLAGEHHDEDQRKILDLQRRLDMMPHTSSGSKGLREQLSQSQSEIALLQKRLEQSESEANRLKIILEQAVLAHETEQSSLRKQLNSKQGANEQVTLLEGQLSEQGEALRTAESQAKALAARNKELSSQNEELSSQNKELSSQNKELSSQNKELSGTLSSTSSALKVAEERVRLLESEKATFEKQSQEIRLQTNMEQESSRKLEREISDLKEQLEEADRQKEKAVRRASADVDDLKEEVMSLKSKLRKSEASVESSSERIEDAENRAKEAEQALESVRSELAELQLKAKPYLDNLKLHEQVAAKKKAAEDREAAAKKRKEEKKQQAFQEAIEDVNLDEAIEF